MKKLTTLFLFSLSALYSQAVYPTITPANAVVTFDKATDVIKYLPPIVITTPANAGFLYSTQVPADFTNAVLTYPTIAYVPPGTTGTVQMAVVASALPVGNYVINVNFSQAAQPVFNLGFGLTINVIDSRNYVPPSASDRFIPHIAVGNGWSTRIHLINGTSNSSYTEVRLYDSSGNSSPFIVNGFRSDYIPSLSIPPYGSIDVEINGEGNMIKTGTAILKTQSGSVPGINIIYVNNQLKTESDVELKPANLTSFNIAFDNVGRNSTGIALGNALNYEQTVTLQWFDPQGQKFNPNNVYTVKIPAYGQVIFTSDLSFPFTQGKVGTLRVTGSQASLIGFGLKFNLDAGTFVTHPAFAN